MHQTAAENITRFFNSYIYPIKDPVTIVEVGACVGGFNIRELKPESATYIGVDLHQSPGVDIVLTDPYILPFEDNSVDFVISASCFEHSEFFWLNFLEILRVLKPAGIFYLNVPSNGDFHRDSVDCWRFYPDSGRALAAWGKRSGYNCEVVECYTSDKDNDIWCDYVSVFIKDGTYINKYAFRLLDNFHNFTNGSVHPHTHLVNVDHSKRCGRTPQSYMFLNIITPCSRPENLHTISKSINIPKTNYRWIVVCDMDELPPKEMIPDNCEIFLHRDPTSVYGHGQRNYALDLIKRGYVYFNDDDTALHPELWENIRSVAADFISFVQLNTDSTVRLPGTIISCCHIDSHNFIVSRDTIGDIKWWVTEYGADGVFAQKCYEKSINKLYIDEPLSIYNLLR